MAQDGRSVRELSESGGKSMNLARSMLAVLVAVMHLSGTTVAVHAQERPSCPDRILPYNVDPYIHEFTPPLAPGQSLQVSGKMPRGTQVELRVGMERVQRSVFNPMSWKYDWRISVDTGSRVNNLEFCDESEDSYDLSTYTSGNHTVYYNSNRPNLTRVWVWTKDD
ncbi:hypothetical protein [Nakamurella leprariae]|uniref:Uncharacterized protein n=1 Tax=Nakamurella leprariae TaxID=2803911 RepID=A0A938YDE5_9ACTN|nr:hypothetical protein [Nakamurella leprariae]MBM9465693.1 hypothetical protein [Nakamurella leprariae]